MIGGKWRVNTSKMVNKRFLQTAERWKNPSLPVEKTQPARPRTQSPVATQSTSFPDLPSESFIFSYDKQHGDYFQELIAKSNEVYSGTRAEIPGGKKGEIKNMYAIKRMALVSTIANNSDLRNYGLWPVTPMQDESLLKEGKLSHPEEYWEDLALVLYDLNGENPQEAQALKEGIIGHRTDLGLSQNDLEGRLVIVNSGAEMDSSMPHGIKPIIIPGITQVYAHEILDKTGENHKFEYGLEKGLPSVSEIGKGNRTLYMPSGNNIGLRVLFRGGGLDLNARKWNLADSGEGGRVNFAPQGQSPVN